VPLVVSVDVLPADVPAEHAAAAVSACSGALSAGTCELASSLPESAQPQAVALVLWQGSGFLQVTIRVSHGGAQWTARSLSFSERDSVAERWTTVGLTIATLVETEHTSGDETAATATPAPDQAPQAAPEPAASPHRSTGATAPMHRLPVAPRERAVRFTLGGLVGQGWQGGRAQLGGFLTLGLRAAGTPFLAQGFASFGSATDATASGRNLVSQWITAGAGGGVTGILDALDLGGSALFELAYRRILVAHGGRDLSTHEWPLRFRAAAAFPAHGRFAATAGAVVRIPTFGASESEPLVLSSPALAAELFTGLEVRL
jgi:hypothetical protein